jgi:hypothetical protein
MGLMSPITSTTADVQTRFAHIDSLHHVPEALAAAPAGHSFPDDHLGRQECLWERQVVPKR